MPIRLTRAVKALLIACFAGFLLQQTIDQFFGGDLLGWLGLTPADVILRHRWWQLVTYAFLHADVMHLVFNLLMLVFLGSELEARWGAAFFLRYYFFCLVSAGVVYLLVQPLVLGADGLRTPMVGASGGIYGLLTAYGILFAERTLLLMLLFPMKAKHFVWVLAGIEFLSSLYSGRNGLSSVAHLSGMGAGFGFLWVRARLLILKKQRQAAGASRPRSVLSSKRKASHLRLVGEAKDGQPPRGAGGSRDSGGPDEVGGGDDGGDSGSPKTWH